MPTWSSGSSRKLFREAMDERTDRPRFLRGETPAEIEGARAGQGAWQANGRHTAAERRGPPPHRLLAASGHDSRHRPRLRGRDGRAPDDRLDGGRGDRRGRIFGEAGRDQGPRSEEHTSELQSLMRISYAVFCLKK